MAQYDQIALEITPSDFMHIDRSGVDAFSALQGLAKHLNNFTNVERYLNGTSTKDVSQFASLMVGQLENP